MPNNRYERIIESVFLSKFTEGSREVEFEREDLLRAARELGVEPPKNIGDAIYSSRYRQRLPQSVQERAPRGEHWVIMPAGRARYRFVAATFTTISPNSALGETKVPDATPGMIALYALGDEQALLAKLRYNRLIDIFTGITCYSLQNHLRTTVPDMGQVETDEIYVGIDRRGVEYVLPVQAKGGRDRLSIVQIAQDAGLCADKFPHLVCRPIAAQFMAGEVIALFDFDIGQNAIALASERHYRLVPKDQVTAADLEAYRTRTGDA